MNLARITQACFAAGALAISGCAATAPGGSGAYGDVPPIRKGTIARLAVDGPYAYINGRLAPGGSYVVDGDTVSTGPGTSAMLLLNEGGTVQLDQNTDPLFKEGLCLLMKMLRGQVLLRNTKCQEFETVKMAGVAHSVVNISSSERQTRITVIDGEVNVRVPRDVTLGKYAEYAIAPDGKGEVRQLTAQQATARMAWTGRYFRPPAARQPADVSGPADLDSFLGGIIGSMRNDLPTPPPDPQLGR